MTLTLVVGPPNHPIIGIRATLRLDLQWSGNIASIKQKYEKGPTLLR